jgi:hypothetical protein
MVSSAWKGFEEFVATQLGLTPTVASGNKYNDPGDAVTRDPNHPFPLYADAKFTEHASFSISLRMLENYTEKAAEVGKRLILPIRLWPRPRVRPADYVVMSFHDFAELYAMAYPRDGE